MQQTTLADLPDELLLDIVEHLDTARDVSHFGQASRRTHEFVQRSGWNSFIKGHFASLRLGEVQPGKWKDVAKKLTYLDRCWEQRAIALTQYSTGGYSSYGVHRPMPGRQSIAPATVLAANQSHVTGNEHVVWGIGEDLVIRKASESYGETNGQPQWHHIHGRDHGHGPGTGDVTALSILNHDSVDKVAVGRADGGIEIRSLLADNTTPQELEVPGVISLREQLGQLTINKSPGQTAITWTEWNASSNLLAACKSSSILFYDLGGSDYQQPIIKENLLKDGADDLTFVKNIKFLDKDTVICGLGASQSPLRCAKLSPGGLQWVDMAQSPMITDIIADHTATFTNKKTTVRAIETVGTNGSLLLSAWDDGTYRLTDIRTPSPYDAVYCDRMQPYDAGSSLLVYGTERFVAGSNAKASLLFFDFRQPKHYHWTTASACSSQDPDPAPPMRNTTPPKGNGSSCGMCEPEHGKMCVWHAKSRSDTYRPDASLMIGEPSFDRVHSLAKTSDTSDSFWCGFRGAVYESRLMLARDVTVANVHRRAPQGWRAHKPESKISFVEAGVGVRGMGDWDDSSWSMNMTKYHFKFRGAKKMPWIDPRTRLDPCVLNH